MLSKDHEGVLMTREAPPHQLPFGHHPPAPDTVGPRDAGSTPAAGRDIDTPDGAALAFPLSSSLGFSVPLRLVRLFASSA